MKLFVGPGTLELPRLPKRFWARLGPRTARPGLATPFQAFRVHGQNSPEDSEDRSKRDSDLASRDPGPTEQAGAGGPEPRTGSVR
jgi:hypothetical protein